MKSLLLLLMLSLPNFAIAADYSLECIMDDESGDVVEIHQSLENPMQKELLFITDGLFSGNLTCDILAASEPDIVMSLVCQYEDSSETIVSNIVVRDGQSKSTFKSSFYDKEGNKLGSLPAFGMTCTAM